MVLDEALRGKIDDVSLRLRNAELLSVATRGGLILLSSFVVLRSLVGLLTGGQGWSVSLALALAAGITYAISLPRRRHTRLTAARFIDEELSLEDRLATAVERSSFDNTAANRLEKWLFWDAANQAPFIKPEELVPYRVPREARWFIPLVLAALVLSFPIYPRGLSWQIGGADVQQAAKRASELMALADQIDRLAQQQPELRELANELRRLGENLRNRQLPQDEALRLLRELEQEMKVGIPGGGQSVDLDISQIQNLAQRLRRIEGPGSLRTIGQDLRSRRSTDSIGAGGSYDEYGDYSDYGDDPRPENGGYRRSGAGTQHAGEDDWNDSDSEGSGNSAGSGRGRSSYGTNNDRKTDGSDGGPGDGPPGDSDFGDDDGHPGGSAAGTSKGSDTRLPHYQRQSGLQRELAPLPGQLSEAGPVFSGKAQGSVAPERQGPTGPTGRSPAVTPIGVEQAIQQENIPLAYRNWVKRYFEALEPGQGQ